MTEPTAVTTRAELTHQAQAIRDEIRRRVAELYRLEHASAAEFVPGKTPVRYAGRVYDEREIMNLTDASLDFWLTLGPYGDKLEKALATFVGTKYAMLVNSGSSANLLAMAALTSPTLERPLAPGDEVITTACGFPTTLNPIIQYGCVPVFVDVALDTLNPRPEWIADAISERTRAVFLPHTLGNPFNAGAVLEICREHGLYLIEDNCDALGSLYAGRRTGSFGHLSTLSFYPPHHMTMGEGGAVLTDDPLLRKVVLSFRDWGRDCWCASGQDNNCGRRFQWQLGSLPYGYDHKYAYSHIGYNLKPLDLQAAIGLAQIEKLPAFTLARRANHRAYAAALAPYESFLTCQQPTSNADPSWFMFFMVLQDRAPFKRAEIVNYLEARNIQTRMLFGGNLLRQPAYSHIQRRTIGDLAGTDKVMNDGFGIGVYPGLTDAMQRYVIESLQEFLGEFRRSK
jgi:CDP-6-deoxy-D-xylo-4-hexulose-3-dehydrase